MPSRACRPRDRRRLRNVYLHCTDLPDPAELGAWRNNVPFTPGCLDRVVVYAAPAPEPPWVRVSPRIWLVLPWALDGDPERYADVAEIIWAFDHEPGTELPLGAWRAAGGVGIWLRCLAERPPAAWAATVAAAQQWATAEGRTIWLAEPPVARKNA